MEKSIRDHIESNKIKKAKTESEYFSKINQEQQELYLNSRSSMEKYFLTRLVRHFITDNRLDKLTVYAGSMFDELNLDLGNAYVTDAQNLFEDICKRENLHYVKGLFGSIEVCAYKDGI